MAVRLKIEAVTGTITGTIEKDDPQTARNLLILLNSRGWGETSHERILDPYNYLLSSISHFSNSRVNPAFKPFINNPCPLLSSSVITRIRNNKRNIETGGSRHA